MGLINKYLRRRRLREILKTIDPIDWSNRSGWDDYDENGIPYWDYFWHIDPITGDAWRLVLNENKN